MDEKESDGRIDIELYPIKNTSFDTKGKLIFCNKIWSGVIFFLIQARKYIIDVFTGDIKKAGTGKK